MSQREIPVVVLGGSGYVAGEALRWLALHPVLRPRTVLSESQPGESLAAVFPHLEGLIAAGRLPARFAANAALEEELARATADEPPALAILSAVPHGLAAAALDRVLEASAAVTRVPVHAVDLSADFRYATSEAYQSVYGHPHGAPSRLEEFDSGVPETTKALRTGARHVGHPGCFTTTVVLAAAPLIATADLIEPDLVAVGVTGSTGAGRNPTGRTHHPERRSNLVAYEPFTHRHGPEMVGLLGRLAPEGSEAPRLAFLPHSGPLARGIHVTLTARLRHAASTADLVRLFEEFYAGAPFVTVGALGSALPGVQSVAGSNRCRIAVAVRDREVAVFSVLDNLVKGAAGGGIQWLNRLCGLPESTGLLAAGPGWL